jgi:hypothetical protein
MAGVIMQRRIARLEGGQLLPLCQRKLGIFPRNSDVAVRVGLPCETSSLS